MEYKPVDEGIKVEVVINSVPDDAPKVFKCQKCGECCTYYNLWGAIDEDMAELLKFHYGVERCEAVNLQIPHRCIHLGEDNLCKIHNATDRPKKCREFFCNKAKGLI